MHQPDCYVGMLAHLKCSLESLSSQLMLPERMTLQVQEAGSCLVLVVLCIWQMGTTQADQDSGELRSSRHG